jgi:hypothetical protein
MLGGAQTMQYWPLFHNHDDDPQPGPDPTGFPARMDITPYVVFWKQ